MANRVTLNGFECKDCGQEFWENEPNSDLTKAKERAEDCESQGLPPARYEEGTVLMHGPLSAVLGTTRVDKVEPQKRTHVLHYHLILTMPTGIQRYMVANEPKIEELSRFYDWSIAESGAAVS